MPWRAPGPTWRNETRCGGAADVRAAVCRAYGGPEVIRVEEMPEPERPTAPLRVAVRAAAVNFPDVLLVADRYQVTVAPPFVPGSEFAGDVTEVADGVVGV